MKPSPTLVLTILLATAGLAMADSQTHQTAQTHATAEAHAEANGNPSSVSKQSVTVTSDGNQTIRKTVTVRDGKEETVTEITDALGHVTRHQDHPGAATEPAEPAAGGDGPFLGVRVQAAPPALRDQLGLAADEGVVVDVVAPKSPAAKVGIRVNDILVALNATKLSTPEGLANAATTTSSSRKSPPPQARPAILRRRKLPTPALTTPAKTQSIWK